MIGRKTFLIIISRYLTQIIGLVGVIILAKLWAGYAVDALGIIGFAMSFIAIFNIISDFGFGQAHIKRISEGKDLGTCIGTYVAIKIFLTSMFVTVTLLAIFIWKNYMSGEVSDATTESVIHVFILYYIFSSLSTIPLKTFVGIKQTVKQQLPGILGRASKVVLTIVVAVSGVTALSIAPAFEWPEFLQPLQKFIADHAVGSLAMTYVFDMIIVLLVGLWFLRKYPIKKPTKEMVKSYFVYALPVMLLSVISIISLNVGRIMIGYFWTSTEVGYYFTVQKITEFIIILSTSVSTLLFPTISRLHASNNIDILNQTTRLVERYISMIMIPPIVVIFVFVYPVINIMLDRSFIPAAPVLMVLAIYAFIYGMKVPYTSLINGVNRPGVGAKIGFVIGCVNIPLNFLFIPKNGLLSSIGINGPTGAAVAAATSMLVGFILLRFSARKLTGINLFQSHTPRHLIAGLVMFGVLYFIAYYIPLFPDIRWYHLFAFSGFGLLIYLGVLFVLKEFNKKDLNFFLSTIHPKSMLGYIKSELSNKK